MLTTSQHITIPTVANHAPVISRFGGDDIFIELSFRRLGALVELVATRVEYSAFTGKHLRDEIAREICEEEEAVDVACDLEWAAVDAMADVPDGYADPMGFAAATEMELAATAKSDRDEYMAYAIAHNSAMVAAE
jgi:hypothetical protein